MRWRLQQNHQGRPLRLSSSCEISTISFVCLYQLYFKNSCDSCKPEYFLCPHVQLFKANFRTKNCVQQLLTQCCVLTICNLGQFDINFCRLYYMESCWSRFAIGVCVHFKLCGVRCSVWAHNYFLLAALYLVNECTISQRFSTAHFVMNVFLFLNLKA